MAMEVTPKYSQRITTNCTYKRDFWCIKSSFVAIIDAGMLKRSLNIVAYWWGHNVANEAMKA